jgi:hypothetical protein
LFLAAIVSSSVCFGARLGRLFTELRDGQPGPSAEDGEGPKRARCAGRERSEAEGAPRRGSERRGPRPERGKHGGERQRGKEERERSRRGRTGGEGVANPFADLGQHFARIVQPECALQVRRNKAPASRTRRNPRRSAKKRRASARGRIRSHSDRSNLVRVLLVSAPVAGPGVDTRSMRAEERRHRCARKLRAELGPVIMSALDDPEVVEIIVNPPEIGTADCAIWLESQKEGMRETRARMAPVQVENIICTVATLLDTVASRQRQTSSACHDFGPTDANTINGCWWVDKCRE